MISWNQLNSKEESLCLSLFAVLQHGLRWATFLRLWEDKAK